MIYHCYRSEVKYREFETCPTRADAAPYDTRESLGRHTDAFGFTLGFTVRGSELPLKLRAHTASIPAPVAVKTVKTVKALKTITAEKAVKTIKKT